MPTLIPTLPVRSAPAALAPAVRQPRFETSDTAAALNLAVYLPAVPPGGIEIATRGPDLIVRARRERPVRVNWQALHLEAAQGDYELKLRLGHGVDFSGLRAEFHAGVLTLVVPKRQLSHNRVTARAVA